MTSLEICREPIDTSGALSLFHASVDELLRRYPDSGEDGRLDAKELESPTGFFLVARLAGDPVGGLGVRTIGDPAHANGEVKRLWVRPDLRRQGIAARLMAAAIDTARREGRRRLYLEVGGAQPEALSFYASSGWTRVEEYPEGVFSYCGAHRFARDL